ncbi:MAG: hypothetical protein GY805_13790 [Chloroflexi bacterium]|nr:hypothetical protein [Chloroflexota bacterium]
MTTQTITTSDKTTATQTAVLGPLQAEYKVHQVKNRANLFFGRLFIVTGSAMLLYGLYTTLATSSGGLNYLCGSFGLLLLLGGVYALWEQRRDKSISVRVYATGLAYTHSGKTDIVRWDDVEAARMSVFNIKSRHGKNMLDTVYGYTITPQTGSDIEFRFNKNSIRNIDELSNTIQREVTRRQLPKAAEIFNQGGKVHFGKLSVDRLGISNGKETIAWSDAEDLKVSKGFITIRKKGKWLNWSNVTVGETPNIFVFLALVKGVMKKKPGLTQATFA